MEEETRRVIDEIDEYGGVEKAIEDGYLQARIAERAHERKQKVDKGESVIVGQNYFRRDDQSDDFGEVFKVDPKAAQRVQEKYQRVMAERDSAKVEQPHIRDASTFHAVPLRCSNSRVIADQFPLLSSTRGCQ